MVSNACFVKLYFGILPITDSKKIIKFVTV